MTEYKINFNYFTMHSLFLREKKIFESKSFRTFRTVFVLAMKEKCVDIDPALNALFLSNVWSICTCNAAFIKTSFFKMIAAQKNFLERVPSFRLIAAIHAFLMHSFFGRVNRFFQLYFCWSYCKYRLHTSNCCS